MSITCWLGNATLKTNLLSTGLILMGVEESIANESEERQRLKYSRSTKGRPPTDMRDDFLKRP